MRRERDALRARAYVDAFALDDVADRVRDVFILARNQPLRHLDDGDLGAEAAIDLREFESDVAAAHHDEMTRHRVQLKDGRVRQERHALDAGEVGDTRASADVDEDARRRQDLITDTDRRWRFKACVAHEDRAPLERAEAALDAIARVGDNGLCAGLHGGHVDARRIVEHDAVIRGAAGEVRGIRARHQRFGRCASGVDAGAAEQFALDEGDGHAGAAQPVRQRGARLPRADDDGVERGHRSTPSASAAPPMATASSMNAAG